MFFTISKLLAFIEQPLNWVLGLMLLSMLLSRRQPRWASRLRLLAFVAFVAIGIVAIPEMLTRRLEDAVPPTARAISSFTGIIVLGGVVQGGYVPAERQQVLLGNAAERMTEAVALARRYPDLQIVFTGFSPELAPEGISEAQAAAQFFEQQGIPAARVLLENRSRNTHENAVFSKQLPGVDATKPWLLVTSAMHMPRAYGVFKKAGWNIEPYPVDYQTGKSIRYLHYSVAGGAYRWNAVLHEGLGFAAYKLTGRM